MKIGIDLRPLQGHNKYRGIGRNILELITALSKVDEKNDYIFYIFEELESPIDGVNFSSKFKYELKKVKFSKVDKRTDIYRYVFLDSYRIQLINLAY